MIMQTFLNTWKNLKNIFRSWVSMSMLIIGPLLIIAILAFSFSSSGFRNVKLGYVNEAEFEMDSLVDSLSYMGKFYPYTNLDVCKDKLMRQALHGCLHIRSLGGDRVGIEAHFDNGREIISLILLENLKSAVIEKENVIVESATEGMLSQVSSVALLMDEGEALLYEMINSLEVQRRQLVDARARIHDAETKYDNALYDAHRNYDSLIVNSGEYGEDAVDEIESARTRVTNTITMMHNLRSTALYLNDSYTADQISSNINYLEDIEDDLWTLQYNVQSDMGVYKSRLGDVDDILDDADDAQVYFDDALRELNTMIITLDSRLVSLRSTKDKIYEQKNKMKEVAGMGTDALLHPFEFEYKPLFSGSKRINKEITPAVAEISEEKKRDLINYGSTQILFPLIIAILVCFIAVILSNIIVLDEMHSPAYFRGFLIPAFRQVFTASLFLTSFVIMFLQIGVLLLVAHYSFYLDVFENIWTILPVVVLIGVVFSLYGMIIAYAVKNKASSLLVCTFLLVITFILSGTIFPIERMSAFMSALAGSLPFSVSVSMLQQSLFYGIPLSQMGNQFGLLLVHVVFTAIVLAIVRFISELRKGRLV